MPLLHFAPLWLRLRFVLRMDYLQQMKRDGNGQYREETDEKEVMRLSAYVHFFVLFLDEILMGPALVMQEQATLCHPLLPPQVQAM